MCRSKKKFKISVCSQREKNSEMRCGLAQETVAFFSIVCVTSLIIYEDNFQDGNALTTKILMTPQVTCSLTLKIVYSIIVNFYFQGSHKDNVMFSTLSAKISCFIC